MSAPEATRTRSGLDALLRPRSVCVLGVSAKRATRGNMAIRSLRRMGFDGRILPIHPQASELEGFAAVPAIEALPEGVDVAFVAVPAADVADVIARLDRAGVRSAVVITAGFTAAQETALKDLAARTRLVMHGPNCMGVLNFSDGVPLYSAELPSKVAGGRVALLAQSGSAAIAVMNTLDVGFSKVATVGSEFRLTAADYLDWLADDPETSVVGVILEAIQSPPAFAAAVRRVQAAGKPVVVLKVGRSAVGAVAAQAHTGALITPSTAYTCFFDDLGVAAVADYDQLAAALTALSGGQARAGTGVAVTGISGGETALMCDLVAEAGLTPAAWSEATAERVRAALPGTTGHNPLDVWASVGQEGGDGHVQALQAIAADPAVGIVVAVQDLQASLPSSLSERYRHPIGAAIALRRTTDKPVIVVSPTPDPLHPGIAAEMRAAGLPALRGMWAGLGALRALAARGASVPGASVPGASVPGDARPPGLAPDALAALKAEIRGQRGVLPTPLCLRILDAYGIPFVRSVTVGPDGALPPGTPIAFPVVVKVSSTGIAHRSDIGGVRLGVADAAALRDAVAAIRANVTAAAPRAVIDGFEIQEEMTGCVEALAGFTDAPPFGPLTVVGSGGTLAELEADRAPSLGVVTPGRAASMIAGTKLGRVLGGYRNLVPRTPLDGLAALVADLTRLAADLADVVSECDLNPVLVRPGSGEARAVDVLMVARP